MPGNSGLSGIVASRRRPRLEQNRIEFKSSHQSSGSLARHCGGMMFFFCSHGGRIYARFGRESARRPISRVLSRPLAGPWMTIPLGRPLPDASRDLPGRRRRKRAWPAPIPRGIGRPAAPMRSCSRWGLPCRRRYRRRGALLPHPFTLTGARPLRGDRRRFAFCCTFPGVAPAGHYPAPCFRGARTFLDPAVAGEAAVIQPSGKGRGRHFESDGQYEPWPAPQNSIPSSSFSIIGPVTPKGSASGRSSVTTPRERTRPEARS